MRLSEIGEFGLIRRLAKNVARGPGVIEGIGDDACVLDIGGDQVLLVTIDMLVEGTHFSRGISPRRLGWKALAVGLSDIAAMGGMPGYFLVSLAIPQSVSVEYVDELYQGMLDLASRFGVSLVGGDTVRSDAIVIDVTVLGQASRADVLLRSGARPGDLMLVTGHLGDSAAGLELLLKPAALDVIPARDASCADALIRAHTEPIPRVAESQAIVRTGGATAMIDISDGLTSEIHHICERSSVGARIWAERVPVSVEARALARTLDKDPLSWALDGGEDYELLFTARPGMVEEICKAVKEATGTDVTVIGEVLPLGEGIALIHEDGTAERIDAGGFNHFKAT